MPEDSPKANSNPMPEVQSSRARKFLAWISWALLLGGPSLSAYTAMLGEGNLKTVLIITGGLLTAFAAAIKTGLSNPLKAGNASATVLCLLGITTLLVGCSDTPYKRIARGYRAVRASAKLAQEFDAAIKNALAAKHQECKAKHGAKTPEFDKCVLPMLRVSRAWTGEKAGQPTGKGVLPSLQAAQKATKLALDAAFDYVADHEKACKGDNAPKDCHGDWQAGIKPALCAAWTVVEAGIKLGAYKATSDPTFKTVQALVTAFACK